MRNTLLLLILFHCFPVSAFDIAEEFRVSNHPPGYCAWASIETLGKHHKIQSLQDLVEHRKKDQDDIINGIIYKKNLGYSFTIKNKLDSLKVKYLIQEPGIYKRDLLEYANKYGCVIAVNSGALEKETHAIVITSYNDKEIRFYNPNQTKTMWIATRQWFDTHWNGYIIVILQ